MKKKQTFFVLAAALLLSVLASCKGADETPSDTVVESDTVIALNAYNIVESSHDALVASGLMYGTWQSIAITDDLDAFISEYHNQDTASQLTPQALQAIMGPSEMLIFDDESVVMLFNTETRSSGSAFWISSSGSFTENEIVITYEINSTSHSYSHFLVSIEDSVLMFLQYAGLNGQLANTNAKYVILEKTSNSAHWMIEEYDEFRYADIHIADLSDFGESILTLNFSEHTVFPPISKMPDDDTLQPYYIIEAGKNPGLGVRALHERGITGKGVSVAIIDQALSLNHPEYSDSIKEYYDFVGGTYSMHGPAVVSILAGRSIGVAPDVDVYYFNISGNTEDGRRDATQYAQAIDMIIEMNEGLPNNEKIRLVSYSAGFSIDNISQINADLYLESVARAAAAGILILDCSPELCFIAYSGYAYDSPEDVALCRPGPLSGFIAPSEYFNDHIFAPVHYRTVAEVTYAGVPMYSYWGQGALSFAVPYVSGVLALGWEVRPELSPEEILAVLFDTAYVDNEGYKHIYPAAFIDALLAG